MIRGLGLIPPNSVLPVIVVPGIMGTNLRAKLKPRLGRQSDERNASLSPGAIAWRPPNDIPSAVREAKNWDMLSPRDRQKLFDRASLEVDDRGPVVVPESEDGYLLTEADLRARGWGEVHAGSYSLLLSVLQTQLNQTFETDEKTNRRLVKSHWKEAMRYDPRKWGIREMSPLTVAHLEKHAKQYYPVYCFGYNWLDDCETSSKLLEKRITEIIDSWRKSKRQCEKVILVTHSMGGLVARACAKRIPEKIAGVIHGVMPTYGAPVAYRRIACGTEAFSPSNGVLEDVTGYFTAKVLGGSTENTTPVLATSPGPLELLPNQLYPGPWLHVRVVKVSGPELPPNHEARGLIKPHEEVATDYLKLPSPIAPNPYDLYRNMRRWYRLIDPRLADPAKKYPSQNLALKAITDAISTAEKFHRSLGDYYHPNTYAFYGDDRNKLSFGQVRWTARQWGNSATALTTSNISTAQILDQPFGKSRRVLLEGKTALRFEADVQDTRGDGTVPHQSGAGPAGKVKQVFAVQGFDHQESYKNNDILMLTLRLIAKIVQEMS
ncbi:esterase/lipase family protein [Massilia sp. X63]|jgi:pimeloyl-ACP methyl ester carboxylesterase|uniref:esterase/lipase family protein n=1 Tax=Massilia sp. X63 TaxID=3237285 RepID=UPI0034DD6974